MSIEKSIVEENKLVTVSWCIEISALWCLVDLRLSWEFGRKRIQYITENEKQIDLLNYLQIIYSAMKPNIFLVVSIE